MYPRLLFLGSRQSIYLKKRNTTLTLKRDVSEFSDLDRAAMMEFKMATIKTEKMHLMLVLVLTLRHLACALVVGKMDQFVFLLVAMVIFNMAAYSRLQNLETSISVVIRTQGFQKHIDCWLPKKCKRGLNLLHLELDYTTCCMGLNIWDTVLIPFEIAFPQCHIPFPQHPKKSDLFFARPCTKDFLPCEEVGWGGGWGQVRAIARAWCQVKVSFGRSRMGLKPVLFCPYGDISSHRFYTVAPDKLLNSRVQMAWKSTLFWS